MHIISQAFIAMTVFTMTSITIDQHVAGTVMKNDNMTN